MNTRNNTNPNGISDMENEFTADSPTPAKARGGSHAVFTPDSATLAKITDALTTQGAITGSKGYGTEKEANSAGRTFKKYATFAADTMGRGIGVRTAKRDSDSLFHWKFQLTSRRVAKPATSE